MGAQAKGPVVTSRTHGVAAGACPSCRFAFLPGDCHLCNCPGIGIPAREKLARRTDPQVSTSISGYVSAVNVTRHSPRPSPGQVLCFQRLGSVVEVVNIPPGSCGRVLHMGGGRYSPLSHFQGGAVSVPCGVPGGHCRLRGRGPIAGFSSRQTEASLLAKETGGWRTGTGHALTS